MTQRSFNIEINVTANLEFKVVNGEILFSPDDQEIKVNTVSVKPGLDVTTFKGMAFYDGKPEDILKDAVRTLTGKTDRGAINIKKGKPALSSKEELRNALSSNIPPIQDDSKEDQLINDFPIQDDNIQEEQEQLLKESLNILNEASINNIDGITFRIIANKMTLSKEYKTSDKRIKNIEIDFEPERTSQLINSRESKNIKIYVGNEETKPKNELEFTKRVFPHIKVNLLM